MRKTVLFGVVVALAACGKSGDGASKADTMAAANAPAPAAPAVAAPAPLTDGNILAKLDADNVADSTAGSMAVSKGTNAGIKEFGRMMMKDHHAMRTEGQALAKKLGITPELPANDPDQAGVQAAADTMNTTPKGAAWDSWFASHAVADHEAVLAFAQNAANTTTNAELKAAIAKATPVVEKHLDAAKKLQAKLGSAAPAAMGSTSKP